MARFYNSVQKVVVRILYLGSSFTNTQIIFEELHRELKGFNKTPIKSEVLKGVSLLEFSFDPGTLIHGYSVQFKIGAQSKDFYNGLELRSLLSETDGLQFIADTTQSMFLETISYFHLVSEQLENAKISNSCEIPIVLHYDKRDLPSSLPKKDLDTAFNARQIPFVELASSFLDLCVTVGFDMLANILFAKLAEHALYLQQKQDTLQYRPLFQNRIETIIA